MYEVFTIFGCYILGEVISKIIPLPGSLLGMGIMFLLLNLEVLKKEKYNKLSNIVLKYLAFFFIPSAINIMNSVEILKGNTIKLSLILIISNVIVMLSVGRAVQWAEKRKVC